MAKQFNPFHKWLGFHEDVTQPNHFQLFGVKPNSEDPIGFRKQIHSRAKLMLAKLEQMSDEEIGGRVKLHTKMRRYVVKAHETLLDDKLRAAYLKAMRQKARIAKGSAKPLAVPPPQKSSVSDPTSQTSKKQVDPKQTMKGGSTPTIKQGSDVNVQTPRAVPMAIPVSAPNVPQVNVSGSNLKEEVNFDNLKSEEIRIRPGRIKRKRSWLIPVLCGLMTLLCIAGIGALVMNFGNQYGIGGNPDVVDPVDPANPVDPAAAKAEDPSAELTPDEIRKETEKLVNAKREELSEKNAGSFSNGSDDIPAPIRLSDPITLSDPQLHSVRFLFDRARREMKRGRLESASEQYQIVESIFDGKRPGGAQAVFDAELNHGREVIKFLEGFWAQVKRSSQKITGGELEPEPGVFIGFVEGRENDVVLRFGENVMIPYRSLRPGLAMMLASKEAAPNVPAWRLQQAAFRIVHSDGSGSAKSKIEMLISDAEADGYDGSPLRMFWNSSMEVAVPEPTMTSVSSSVSKEIRRQLVGDKYGKISRISPADAETFAKGFTSVAYDNPEMRIAALTESVELCLKSGDAYQMVDTIDELHRWTEIESAQKKADGFRVVSSKVSSPLQARVVGGAFYEFLQSPDAANLKPGRRARLTERVLETVTSNGLDDLRRLISQTMDN